MSDVRAPRVVVTGGAAGIGRAIADRFVADGATVCVVDLDDRSGRDWLAAHEGDGRVSFHVGDVSDPALATTVAGHVQDRYGGIDVLVNNAAVSRYEPVLDITVESWRQVIDTNLSGYFFWAQAAARVMVRQTFGRIINVASVNSFAAEPAVAHYVAAKGGVAALTRALAVDLAAHGITVNAVAPGPTRTQRNAHLYESEPLATQLARVPVGRAGTTEEVADAVAWLAGANCGYVNGHTLVIDGGLLARI